MQKELNLFIIWQNARHKETEILADMANNYEIVQIYNMTWSKEHFAENLTRFYGKKLPNGCKKHKLCGEGDFLLVLVNDLNPDYKDSLNVNPIRSKILYRNWTGGGHLIHSCDNADEAKENLLFLLGITPEEYTLNHPEAWDGKIINLKQDLVGTPTWKDKKTFYDFVNKLPNTIIDKSGKIISPNPVLTRRFLNTKKKLFSFKRNLYQISIGEKKQVFIIN